MSDDARYPRPAVLDRVPLTHHAVIEASAGTGKTFTIEHLVVEVLLRTAATIDQILVLTFTEKATVELKKRIRGLLARILSRAAPGAAGPGAAWLIDRAARQKLEEALLAFDTASIHTIHGFFQRVLTSNAFPIGRPLVQEMVDGRAAFARAFTGALRSEVAVEPALRCHLVAWLEGAGKSLADLEELAFRCLPYHRRGTPWWPAYRPDELAVFIVANAPACPSADAVKTEVPKLRLNSIRATVTRLEGLYRTLCAFRDSGDMLALLAALGEFERGKGGTRLDSLRERLDGQAAESGSLEPWRELIDGLLERVVSVESAVVQAVMPSIVRQLDEGRAARGQFDFDDLIRLVWEALGGPGAEALASSLRARYHYALVDEFQDTDDLQWKILKRLFFEIENDAPGGRHVCYLVGDPKQAIYGFRGADVHAYIEATRHVQRVHAQAPVPLDASFRSTPALIDALNLVFRQDDPAPFFTDPAIQYLRPVTAGRPQLALTTASGRPAAPVVVLRVPPSGEKLRIDRVRRMLARTIARDVARLLGGDPAGALLLGEPGTMRHVEPSEVFVLTRTASEGRLIGEALREAAVPHAFYKQDGLFGTPEATDVRDLLMAIEAPGDRSRRFRAWLSPFFDVPIADLSRLADLPHSHPLVQRLEDWHDLARRREHERLFTALADESGLVRRLLESSGERELTNYLHLFEILMAQAQAGARLCDLIVELSACIAGERRPPGENSDVQRLESDRAAVQIMTMHKSKGLEADVVYLFGGFSSGPPKSLEPVLFHLAGERVQHVGRSPVAARQRELEEERENERLLYVALTRARGRVVLPLLPAGELRSLEGSAFATVNRRLSDLLARGVAPAGFEVRDVTPEQGGGAPSDAARPVPAAFAWPAELEVSPEAQEMAKLARRHGALRMTSYSRIKREHGGYVSPLDADSFKGEAAATAAPPPLTEVEPDALPGGVAMGIMLHEMIEDLPLDSFAGHSGVEAWAAEPRVKKVLDEKLARHGMNPALSPAIARLLHRSLTAPVQVGEATLPGLAAVTASAREMEFVFPYPEVAHPALADALAAPLSVERGYVQGVIDLVFELSGRLVFADWKTDILPDYGAAAVQAHVSRNYKLQSQLYALAMVKILNIRDRTSYDARFGGLLYCFLRGMRPVTGGASPGVYFERPEWGELVAFDGRLREGGSLA